MDTASVETIMFMTQDIAISLIYINIMQPREITLTLPLVLYDLGLYISFILSLKENIISVRYQTLKNSFKKLLKIKKKVYTT